MNQEPIIIPEIHLEFPEQLLVPTPSVAENLMQRDIMLSEPRHWMVFGQLVMPVQRCKDKARKAKEASVRDQWAPIEGTLDARGKPGKQRKPQLGASRHQDECKRPKEY